MNVGKGSIRGQALDQDSSHSLSPSDAFHCPLFAHPFYAFNTLWLLSLLNPCWSLDCPTTVFFFVLKLKFYPECVDLSLLHFGGLLLALLGFAVGYDMSKVQEGGDMCLFFRGWISSPISFLHVSPIMSCHHVAQELSVRCEVNT